MTDTASTPSPIERRKGRHLAVCLDRAADIESSNSRFDQIQLCHRALPEVDRNRVDLAVDFLGQPLRRPFFISCMTGGAPGAGDLNRQLARAAQAAGVPVGLGSIRVLFERPECWEHFHVKPLAPDVPVWANLGLVQLRDIDGGRLADLLGRLEVQALVVHCNAAQELCQPGGDRDFTGLWEALRRTCDQLPLPVIVKETGCGLAPGDIERLIDCGAAAVDVAGTGGTHWVKVEAVCQGDGASSASRLLGQWGYPTATVLAALDEMPVPILASGGIRSGLDVAKALALGAHLAGLALPLIRAAHEGGSGAVLARLEDLAEQLRDVMVLTGCRSLSELRTAPTRVSMEFLHEVQQLRQPGRWRAWGARQP